MQVDVAAAGAWDRERKPHHDVTIKGAHHLATNLVGYDKHAERHQLRVGKVPDLFLQCDAGAKFFDAVADAEHDRIDAHRLLAAKASPLIASSRKTAFSSRPRDLAWRSARDPSPRW